MLRQRNPRSPIITKVRPMTQADIASLREKSCVPAPQRMRESYHWIAYLLSTGMTQSDIAAQTGYSQSRISFLANSPAMREAIAGYRREILKPQIAAEVEGLKAACGHRFYRMLSDYQHSLDEEDQLPPLRDILAGIKTVYGNSGTTVNVNVGFAARLEQAVAATRRLEVDADG